MVINKIKPRLLIATDTYFPKKDGVIIFLAKVLPSLAEEYDITILAPEFTRKARKIKGCNLIRLPVTKKLKVAGYRSVAFSFKNLKVIAEQVRNSDIVWSQDLAFIGGFAIYYAKKYRKHTMNYVHQITTEHAVDVLKINDRIKKILAFFVLRIVRMLYNRCDILMIPYAGLDEELRQNGIGTKKVVIRLGVDSNKFKPLGNKDLAKRRVGIAPDYNVIGYCGRLSKEKDLETLRQAYNNLKRKKKKTCLLVVGSGPEKKEFKEMKDVILTGAVKNPAPYYQAMDIFVMPSLTETTSLATLEAMSSGIACVVTKIGYMKYYIKDRINGFFFPKKNSYVLQKKLEILMEDPDKLVEIGKEARETILTRFTWEETIKKLKRILREH